MTTTPKTTARDEAKQHLRDHFAKAGPAIAAALAKHTTPTIHETLPSGFHFADRLQVEAFEATGSIDGASKVAFVAGAGELPRLATRLRPPRDWNDAMILAYKAGWKDARAGAGKAFGTDPYVKGWLDAARGRMKWHSAYCSEHDRRGCGVA